MKQAQRVGPTAGQLLRAARRRHGVSQARLAARAGTTQSAISRIENDRVSPSVETLWELLYLLGEDLELASQRRDSGVDITLNEANLRFTPADRVKRGLSLADSVRRTRGKRPDELETWGHVGGPPPLEPNSLLRVLVAHGVDFVLIGGIAGIARGSSYPTYDLDVAYARDPANLERLAKALAEIGVTPRGAPAELPFVADAQSLAAGADFTFDTRFGMFDIFGDVAGVTSYEALRREATVLEVDGLAIRVASLSHLIAMKRSANRPKDWNMLLEYVDLAGLPDPAASENGD